MVKPMEKTMKKIIYILLILTAGCISPTSQLIEESSIYIELEDLVKDLKFNTVVDIGSNKGQFILLIEKLFYSDKIIYSFEPIKEVFEKQKKRLSKLHT